jgi:hypothetical protein
MQAFVMRMLLFYLQNERRADNKQIPFIRRAALRALKDGTKNSSPSLNLAPTAAMLVPAFRSS